MYIFEYLSITYINFIASKKVNFYTNERLNREIFAGFCSPKVLKTGKHKVPEGLSSGTSVSGERHSEDQASLSSTESLYNLLQRLRISVPLTSRMPKMMERGWEGRKVMAKEIMPR